MKVYTMQNIAIHPLVEKSKVRTVSLTITTKKHSYYVEKSKVRTVSLCGLFTTLADKGLNRLTNSKIEHIICTSSLAAFN